MFSIARFNRWLHKSSASKLPASGISEIEYANARCRAAFCAAVRKEADYNPRALNHALSWAAVTEYPVTLCGLRAAYNDYRYSLAGFASVKGS